MNKRKFLGDLHLIRTQAFFVESNVFGIVSGEKKLNTEMLATIDLFARQVLETTAIIREKLKLEEEKQNGKGQNR